MTPAQLKALRLSLGLSASEFALALGFGGTKASRGNMIYALEAGSRPIPATMKYRVLALGNYAPMRLKTTRPTP